MNSADAIFFADIAHSTNNTKFYKHRRVQSMRYLMTGVSLTKNCINSTPLFNKMEKITENGRMPAIFSYIY